MVKNYFKPVAYAVPLVLAGLLVGCSGGSGTGDLGGNTDLVDIQGQALNGYLYNARVCLDVNENQRCDEEDPQTWTGTEGRFVLENVTPQQRADYALVVEIDGENTLIGDGYGVKVGRDFVMEGIPGRHDIVSPYTTLIRQQLRDVPGEGLVEVAETIANRLGISEEDARLLQDDYLALERRDISERMQNTASVITRTMAGLETELGPRVDFEPTDLDPTADPEQTELDSAADADLDELDERLARREAILATIIEQLEEVGAVVGPNDSVDPDRQAALAEDLVARFRDDGLEMRVEERFLARQAARNTGGMELRK